MPIKLQMTDRFKSCIPSPKRRRLSARLRGDDPRHLACCVCLESLGAFDPDRQLCRCGTCGEVTCRLCTARLAGRCAACRSIAVRVAGGRLRGAGTTLSLPGEARFVDLLRAASRLVGIPANQQIVRVRVGPRETAIWRVRHIANPRSLTQEGLAGVFSDRAAVLASSVAGMLRHHPPGEPVVVARSSRSRSLPEPAWETIANYVSHAAELGRLPPP